MKTNERQLDGLRTRALAIPLDEAQRLEWARQFNLIPAVRRFEISVALTDPALVGVTLPKIEDYHLGGLRVRAVNGAVLSGLFDCALGVAGTLQFAGKRSGTCELSMKFMRAVFDSPLEVFSGCVKRTDTLAFVEAELYSADRLCALATGLVAVAADRGGEEAFW
jgi:acyl-coenzyme A thioesterase PaaI-like protein